MAVAIAERTEFRSPPIKPEIEEQGLEILKKAKYALRWNTPDITAALLAKNQARIKRLSLRIELKEIANVSFPGDDAEERHLLTKTREDTTRLMRLGLSRGTTEQGAPGLIVAIPANNKPETPISDIGDRYTVFQLWYMPREAIAEAIAQARRNKIADNIEGYVLEAATSLIASPEVPETSSPDDKIHRIELDRVAAAGVMRVARFMRNNNLQGRVPYRTELRIKEVLHSGALPVDNVVNFSPRNQAPIEKERTA